MSHKSKRKKDFPCLKCNNHVKTSEYAIKCALCDLWVHKDCEGMDTNTFDVLDMQHEQTGQCFWSCKSCRSYALKFDKRMRDIEKRVVQLEESVPKISSDLTNLKTEVANVKASVATMKNSTVEIQHNAASSVFSEMREREHRRSNLVIHNLVEPDASETDNKLRMEMDKEKMNEVCQVLNVTIDVAADLRFAKRLGERSDDHEKPRPLLLGFKNNEVREKLLEKSPNLAEIDVWKKVSIVQDLTPMQRTEEKSMREDAAKKNSDLTAEDAENWEWKVVGRRGERRVVRAAREKVDNSKGSLRRSQRSRQQRR